MKIKRYQKIDKGNLNAYVDVLLLDDYDCEINGIRIVNSRDGKKFVSMPQREYVNEEGEKKYSPIIFVKNKKAFDERLFKEIDRFLKSEPEQANSFDDMPF